MSRRGWAVLGAVGLAVLLAGGGAFLGPVWAAVGAAVGGFTPLLVERVTRRQEQQAKLEAVRSVTGTHGPAAVLDAHVGVVPFTGREDELAELEAWCASDSTADRVRLLTGGGGVGKTRLALRVAERLQARRWQCVEVGKDTTGSPGKTAVAMQAARAEYPRARLLLIVDYAETRSGLGQLVEDAFRDSGVVRVLLVTRGKGEWWEQLCRADPSIRNNLEGTVPIQLEAPVVAGQSDEEIAQAALHAFAAYYRILPPRVRFRLASPGRLPVLVLHAAALVAVLDSATAASRDRTSVVDTTSVLDSLLSHEAVYWTPEPPIPELGPGAQAHAVALLSLAGANDEAQVAELLDRVPELKGLPAGRLQVVASWLHSRYPGATREAMGTLQPDLVAERHAVKQIASSHRLAGDLLTGLSPIQAVRALTVLTRAYAHSTEAYGILAEALRADMDHLAGPAVMVAVQTNGPLARILDEVIVASDIPPGQLQEISDMIPFRTVALADMAVTVDRRILDQLPANTPPADRAKRAAQFAIRLSQSGRYSEALFEAEDALNIFHDLVAAGSDEIRPVLAASLANQSIQLADLGRRDEALATAGQAIQAYRDLAETDPAVRRYLATALYNRSNLLAESGRPQDAVEAADEAITICRNLSRDHPGEFDAELASALNNRSSHRGILQQREEALKDAAEAEQLYRKLVRTQPDAFLPGLASALTNKANHTEQLNRPQEALEAAEEAARTYRQLAEALPGAYLPRLARVLTIRSLSLTALDMPQEALEAASEAEEALNTYRNLPETRPEMVMPDLVRVWMTMAAVLFSLGRYAEAATRLAPGFVMAAAVNKRDLVTGTSMLLLNLHQADPAGVSLAWREATGTEIPAWIIDGSKDAPAQ